MKSNGRHAAAAMCLMMGAASVSCFAANADKSGGTVVAKGAQFVIEVTPETTAKLLTESKIQKYRVSVVSQSARHTTQRSKQTIATVDADLTQPENWRVRDYDGDGLEDYAYLRGVDPRGCHTWHVATWRAESSRFVTSPKNHFAEDKNGKALKSCVELALQ